MTRRGYTLIELMVAVGLFALIMTLASGAYLVMIGINRQTQGITAGIDDLSFALETMMRSIRTGTGYNCGGPGAGDCAGGADSFYFTNASGATVSYSIAGSAIQEVVNGVPSPLTDSSLVKVISLMFYVSGTSKSDSIQPHVTVTVSGTISPGHGKPDESFTVETGATMRGADL